MFAAVAPMSRESDVRKGYRRNYDRAGMADMYSGHVL
jgi:hypothetical protein